MRGHSPSRQASKTRHRPKPGTQPDRLEDLPENTIVFANIERTAIGDFNGAFKDVKATELGGQLVRSVLEGTGIDDISEQVDAIFVGQIFQTEDGMAPANQIKYFLGSVRGKHNQP